MTAIERHGSGGAFEASVGYSRVIRAGDRVLVAGTTATTPDGAIAGIGDPYAQMVQILTNVEAALARVGATLAHVVRTRAYLTDTGHFDGFARAHGEAFGDVRPVNTTVVVAALVDPRMLVELEVEAYLPDGAGA
jgi:enamine deaminase RidA (YjgF/YER057c/UK114 family)